MHCFSLACSAHCTASVAHGGQWMPPCCLPPPSGTCSSTPYPRWAPTVWRKTASNGLSAASCTPGPSARDGHLLEQGRAMCAHVYTRNKHVVHFHPQPASTPDLPALPARPTAIHAAGDNLQQLMLLTSTKQQAPTQPRPPHTGHTVCTHRSRPLLLSTQHVQVCHMPSSTDRWPSHPHHITVVPPTPLA
jgi:hypothetical protein